VSGSTPGKRCLHEALFWGVRASRVESAAVVVVPEEERLCSLLLRAAARDFPTLTPEEPASAAAAKGNDCDQAEDEDDT
jgi:hypothetical protein